MTAKELAIENYKQKATTADQQIRALLLAREFKISQLQNKLVQQRMKVKADSMDMLAAERSQNRDEQFRRQKACTTVAWYL